MRRALPFSLLENRYADHAAKRCHANTDYRENEPDAQGDERWMALHRVGHLPYHLAGRRIRDAIGSLVHCRNDAVPLKQGERNTNDKIYE